MKTKRFTIVLRGGGYPRYFLSSVIKMYQWTKYGREYFEAIISQYTGEEKWESDLKKHEGSLHNRTWKGQINFPFEKHFDYHQNT